MSGLFTVLIAEKEHIDAIQQGNNLFFEPFLKNKELAFCQWNPLGETLGEAVPGLLDIVGRKEEWRAVILNNSDAKFIDKQNPFDVVDFNKISSIESPNRQLESNDLIEEWEQNWKAYYENLSQSKEIVYNSALEFPLQKLSTWLCYRPEEYVLNEVVEKEDVYDWAIKEIGREEIKPSVRLELFEKEQYKNDLRLKENLRRAFVAGNYLNIAYPAQVHCISIRTSENNFFDPETFWNTKSDHEYSAFVDRNMYFDKMRFLVFDLLPKTHRNYRTDYIRYLASILIFATNAVPISSLQARRLYSIETKTDDTPLCTLITSYDKKLAATFETIENEMEKICAEIPSELTDKTAESMFCTSQDVPVVLDDSCNSEKVYAEKDYGLFFDAPINELHKWNSDFITSQKELGYIVKQQGRSVKKSVSQAHLTSEISDVNISRLTPLQIEDVKEYTDSCEDEMVDAIPANLMNMSVYANKMEKESENIKSVLKERMTKKTVLILSSICLGLFLVCFLPFLFSNGNTGKTVMTAIGLVLGMLGFLLVVMLVTLIFLRLAVIDAVQSYNSVAHDVLNDIQHSLKQFSKYLSAFCNVRRGHAVQNYADKNLDEYTKSLRIRKKHQEDIRKKRACLVEDYGDYLGDKTFCDEAMSRPYDYDFDQAVEYEYPVPFLAGDSRQIEFLSAGNFVTVPTSYVKRISVRMEEIYER